MFDWDKLEGAIKKEAPPNNSITAHEYALHNNCSETTAFRRLKRAVCQGIMVQTRIGWKTYFSFIK